MQSPIKLYAVHDERTPLPANLYKTPAKALLAFLLRHSREGTFGQTKGLYNLAGQGARSLFLMAKDIVAGKVATELEFLESTDFYLSEFTLDDPSKIRQTAATSIKFVVPVIFRKPDGNIDANATLLNYEKLLRQSDPVPPSSSYAVEEIPSSGLNLRLTQRFSINWEVLALSFVAFLSLNASFEKIETDLPKVFNSFITQVAVIPARPAAVMFVPTIPRLPQATPSVVQSTLTPVGNQQVQCNIITGKGPLAQIICGQLAIGPSWKEVLEKNRCTIGGYKIAESLIKVAATRIFSIPEQSIMEPIVNSLDAYQPARKVGKFGMGFFSLLYWVVQNPKATLTIVSSYREANFVKPCSYRAVISNNNAELYVEVAELATTPASPTGFQLTLNFGSPVDDETFDRFVQQLNRLQYVTSAVIIVNQAQLLNTEAIRLRQQSDPQYQRPKVAILVNLNKNSFSTDDKATGLPIETFYSTLIVPSISSKTIALSTAKDLGFIDQSRITPKLPDSYDEDYNSFRITIGEVVIVDLKFGSVTDAADSSQTADSSIRLQRQTVTVLMTLPLQTRVPVSRDDVLLASVLPEVNAALLRLLNENLTKYLDTTYLEEALLAFGLETASNENLEIIKAFLNSLPQQLRDRQLVGVPVLEDDLYKRLNPRYVTTLNYDQAWLEAQLRVNEASTDEFFLNKRVIFSRLPQGVLATNGGTSSFIFVNEAFPPTVIASAGLGGQIVNWPVNLAVSYKRDVLYPTGTNFGESLSRAVLQYTETFRDARSRLLMETLAGKYQAALDLREPADGSIQYYLSVQVPIMIQYLERVYYRVYQLEDFHAIIGSIITMLDNAEPNIAAYGDRLTIRCANAPSVDDLMRVMNVTLANFIVQPLISFKAFRTALLNGQTQQNLRQRYPDLLIKASQYQVALLDRTVRLAIKRRYLNLAAIDPFSAGYEFNILVELNYAVYALNRAGTADRVFVRTFLTLLTASTNAFQFILAYIILHVLFRMLSPVSSGIRRVPTVARELLKRLRQTSSSAELGEEIATILLSTVTKNFGTSPGTAIQTYHRLVVNSGIYQILNYQNIFDFYFQELFRPALDVYAWLERRVNVSTLIQEVDRGIADNQNMECYRFTLSKLVEFVFQEELPKTNLELFQRVSQFKSKIPARLQIIELAISAGTAKSAIPAKLTELVQNSTDAIRQALASGTTFEKPQIDIVVKKLRGQPELLIGVADPVGIPPNGIVALSIPFLSGKQASDIVTGEIGSGFFNVYREAVRVLIITTREGITTEMSDTPVIDQNTRQIVDVDRCATVKRTNLPNGTQILVQSRHNELAVTDAAIEAISFTRETLGLITEGNVPITLNGTPINIPLTLVYQTEFFEFRTSPINFNSYILTKGVPFAELHKYLTALGFFNNFTWLLDQLKTSVSLNVKSGVFTPVQTRTKIGLSRRNANLLVKAIIEAAFFVILYKIEHKLIDESEIDQYMQYYSSTAIINQVLPAASDAASWSRQMQLFTTTTSERIRDVIMLNLSRVTMPFMAMDFSTSNSSMGQGFNLTTMILTSAKLFPDIGKIQRFLNSYIEGAGLSPESFPGQTIFNVTYRWLVSKKRVPVEMVRVPVGPTTGPQDRSKAKTVLVEAPRYLKGLLNPNHQTFIQLWIETYHGLAQRVIPGWPAVIPTVAIDLKRDSPFNGEYYGATNTITLYYEYMVYPKTESGLDYLSRIIEVFRTAPEINNAVLTLETNNPTWRKFFMPKGTIAHELEHYRSKDDHQKSSHGNVRMNLPYGGLRERVFLLQHHDTMLSLPGFYVDVANAVRRML